MNIQQFRYSSDNLGYLVYSTKEAIAIDAGGVSDILSFAEKNKLFIKYVSNTHSHHDHTSGNNEMLKKTSAQFIDCKQLKPDQTLSLDTEILEVIHTPGHTDDSVTFKADGFLVTGDTLFNGTIGNCFSGDLKGFFNSLKRLIALPKETKIYSGHDYVIESMKMAKLIEKDNPYIEAYVKKYNSDMIVSTLQDELNANPYVRFNAPDMINNLQKRNLKTDTEYARFKSIMDIY